eukprot:10114-Rhodomonas_salina.4
MPHNMTLVGHPMMMSRHRSAHVSAVRVSFFLVGAWANRAGQDGRNKIRQKVSFRMALSEINQMGACSASILPELSHP